MMAKKYRWNKKKFLNNFLAFLVMAGLATFSVWFIYYWSMHPNY